MPSKTLVLNAVSAVLCFQTQLKNQYNAKLPLLNYFLNAQGLTRHGSCVHI